MHRTFLSAALVCLLLSGGQTSKAVRTSTPNVVIIYVDDMGYADLASYGEIEHGTPNLDKMADEGVRFTNFYVSQPVCSASRASLLTGTYANRIGIHGALGPGDNHGISDDELTLAELFKARGYATAIYGKWHLGHHAAFLPTRHGFDEFYGIPYSNDMWPYHPESPSSWGDLPTIEGDSIVGYNTDQSRFTTDFTDRAVAFVERNAAQGTPFFLYLAHPMPHVPLAVSSDRAGRSGAGLYGDVIEELDWSVGKVLAALKASGIDENTLLMFASDNGPWLSYGNHAGSAEPLREGKGTVFEGGVRVPFLARWPGTIPEGLEVSAPAMTIDVLPTMADLIQVDLPAYPIDGKSIWGLMTGDSSSSPQQAYYFYYHTNQLQAMRSGKWKLHFPHTYRTLEGQAPGMDGIPGKYDYAAEIGLALYDLDRDPSESNNLAAEFPEVVEALSLMADSQRAELGDALTFAVGAGLRKPGMVSSE